MKLQAFAVFDNAVTAYLPPFFVRSMGEAVRSFQEAANDEKHQFSKHAADYILYFVGEFDDNSGMFNPSEPTRIGSAREMIVPT